MGLSPERETDQPLPSPWLRLVRGQLPQRRALVLGKPGVDSLDLVPGVRKGRGRMEQELREADLSIWWVPRPGWGD